MSNTQNTVPGKARRDFLFYVFSSIAPRFAFEGMYVPDADHPNYAIARQQWVGQAQGSEAIIACDWLEQRILRVLENEAKDSFNLASRKAKQNGIALDKEAQRARDFKKMDEFVAKIVELKAAEVKRDQDRAANEAKKSGAQAS